MASSISQQQERSLPPTPGPTLERHDPQDPGLYHANPHTDLPEHLNVQDEGPHVVEGPTSNTKESAALDDPVKIERARRICGLPRRYFWILLVLAILIVVGAIAGGLGGALAAQKTKKPSTTTSLPSLAGATVTATISPSSTANATVNGDNGNFNATNIKSIDDCKDKTLYSSPVNNFQFLMRCRTSFGFYNEIMDIFTVSMALCMDACAASHATDTNPNATSCSRIAYEPNATSKGGNPNCYLLSANDTQGIGGDSSQYDTADSNLNGSGRKHKRRSHSIIQSLLGS